MTPSRWAIKELKDESKWQMRNRDKEDLLLVEQNSLR